MTGQGRSGGDGSGAGRGGSGASSGVEAAAVPRFGGGAAGQVVESVAHPVVRRRHRRRRVPLASSAACGVRGRARRPRGVRRPQVCISQLELTQSRYSQSPQWRMDWFILQRKDR